MSRAAWVVVRDAIGTSSAGVFVVASIRTPGLCLLAISLLTFCIVVLIDDIREARR